MTLTLLALLACKGGDADDTAAVDSEPQAEGVDAIAARYLSGRFDSSAQEARDPRYYNISLVTCPITLPELGEQVLYVEQALADTPSDPYRQRVYTVSALEDGRALTAIYAFIDPDPVVGLCDASGALPFAVADLTERTGCGVYLSWDGAAFEGSTEGEGCGTTLGGDYATSEVTINAELLTSWDRGWYDDGSQAWGAEAGPYEFDRLTPLE